MTHGNGDSACDRAGRSQEDRRRCTGRYQGSAGAAGSRRTGSPTCWYRWHRKSGRLYKLFLQRKSQLGTWTDNVQGAGRPLDPCSSCSGQEPLNMTGSLHGTGLGCTQGSRRPPGWWPGCPAGRWYTIADNKSPGHHDIHTPGSCYQPSEPGPCRISPRAHRQVSQRNTLGSTSLVGE